MSNFKMNPIDNVLEPLPPREHEKAMAEEEARLRNLMGTNTEADEAATTVELPQVHSDFG